MFSFDRDYQFMVYVTVDRLKKNHGKVRAVGYLNFVDRSLLFGSVKGQTQLFSSYSQAIKEKKRIGENARIVKFSTPVAHAMIGRLGGYRAVARNIAP